MKKIDLINESFNTCYGTEKIINISINRGDCPRETIEYLARTKKIEDLEMLQKLKTIIINKEVCRPSCNDCRRRAFEEPEKGEKCVLTGISLEAV